MWVAADVKQLVRLGKQAWVTVPAPPKEQQEQVRACSAPTHTASMAPAGMPHLSLKKRRAPRISDTVSFSG